MMKQTLSLKANIKINHRINNKIINSMRILQMSASEVEEFISKEIDQNPFLLAPKLIYKNNNIPNVENQAENLNIKEWLYQQSSFLSINLSTEKLIQSYIENLDDFGFCKIKPLDAAKLTNTSEELAINILVKLKLLDPIGIFSYDLKEHLAIQLKKIKIFNDGYQIILDNLNHVASSNFNHLSKLCKVDIRIIDEMINNIKKLKPRPLDGIAEKIIERLIPDIVIKIHNNKINIKLCSEDTYKVLFNKNYIKEIKLKLLKSPNTDTTGYIRNCISHGKTLQNNLNRRNNTLLLVADKILSIQKEFFFKGSESIVPLTHKNISKILLMHESTISRTVKNKYIKFNNKTIPLNYFFNSKLGQSSNSKTNSSISIKTKIRNLIDSEKNIKNIYSDQNITDILNQLGVNISRRTVTKYRESLKISNSIKRSQNLY